MSNSHEMIQDGKQEETTSNDAKTNVNEEVANEVVEASSTTGANQLNEAAPDSKLKTDEAGATLVKTSQRKIRLNRRGFHLAALETKDAAEKDINGNNDSPTKDKSELPKKVISLRSVKRNLPEQTLEPPKKKFEKIIFDSLKKEEKASSKTESRQTSEISSSKDLPAPKKHKLITWP